MPCSAPERRREGGRRRRSAPGFPSARPTGCTAIKTLGAPLSLTRGTRYDLRNRHRGGCATLRVIRCRAQSSVASARCPGTSRGTHTEGARMQHPARYTHETASSRKISEHFHPHTAHAESLGFAPPTGRTRVGTWPWWTRAMPADTPISAVTSRVVSGSSISATPANRPNIGVNSVRADN